MTVLSEYSSGVRNLTERVQLLSQFRVQISMVWLIGSKLIMIRVIFLVYVVCCSRYNMYAGHFCECSTLNNLKIYRASDTA